jgi:hypothetical protein
MATRGKITFPLLPHVYQKKRPSNTPIGPDLHPHLNSDGHDEQRKACSAKLGRQA